MTRRLLLLAILGSTGAWLAVAADPTSRPVSRAERASGVASQVPGCAVNG